MAQTMKTMILDENEFVERFDLAEPGKEFALYSEAYRERATHQR